MWQEKLKEGLTLVIDSEARTLVSYPFGLLTVVFDRTELSVSRQKP